MPVGRDARAVLKELGTPEEIAAQYYEHRRHTKKKIKMNTKDNPADCPHCLYTVDSAGGFRNPDSGYRTQRQYRCRSCSAPSLPSGLYLQNMFLPMPDGQIRGSGLAGKDQIIPGRAVLIYGMIHKNR